MHTLKRTLAAGTAALVVAGSGAGAAFACDGHHGNSGTQATSFNFGVRQDFDHHRQFGHHFGFWMGQQSATWSAVVTAVTNYLGLSTTQIKTDLENGQSLAQIATAQQKDPNALVQVIVNAIKPQLDAAVTAGKIDSTQETNILSALTTKVTAVVNNQFTFGHHDTDNDGD